MRERLPGEVVGDGTYDKGAICPGEMRSGGGGRIATTDPQSALCGLSIPGAGVSSSVGSLLQVGLLGRLTSGA